MDTIEGYGISSKKLNNENGSSLKSEGAICRVGF